MRVVLLLALLVLAASCRVGPNYRAPDLPNRADAPLTSVYVDRESRDEPPDAWWHLYGDAQMDALIGEAFSANRDLKIAEANLYRRPRSAFRSAQQSLPIDTDRRRRRAWSGCHNRRDS